MRQTRSGFVLLVVLLIVGALVLFWWLTPPQTKYKFLYVVTEKHPGYQKGVPPRDPDPYKPENFVVRDGRLVGPFPPACVFYVYDAQRQTRTAIPDPTHLRLNPSAVSPDGFELYVEGWGHAWSNYSRPLEARLHQSGKSGGSQVDLGLILQDRFRFGFIGWIVE